MTPSHSYRVTIKEASALAILESLEAMQAIELAPEPAVRNDKRADVQSLRGTVAGQASEAMLRHTEAVRSEWGSEGRG